MESEKLCEKALAQNQDRLSELPNVVGLGVVSRLADRSEARGLAVGVYVSRKVPRTELRPGERIPRRLRVRIRGGYRMVPVRVIEQGEAVIEPAPRSAERDTSAGGRDGTSGGPALGKESL